MAGLKYSIPKNYEIREHMGLKGIIRKGKNGEKWLWEPVYLHIVIGKSFGKILVASLSQLNAMKGEEFFRLTEYTGEVLIPAKIYDILIGENCLYIKTLKKDTNELGWFMIADDFKGAKFIGDFEPASRDRINPFHIPVGTLNIIVRVEDTDMKLELHTGELSEIAHAIVDKPVEEEVLDNYNIYLNSEIQSIQLLNPANNRIVKKSNSLGDLESYEEIVEAIMGGFENVPRERAEKLLEFLSRFEYYGNALAIPIMYEYVKARTTGDINTILAGMVKELDADWVKLDNENSAKIYSSGSIMLGLVKLGNGKISVAPYIINGEDNIMEVSDVESLVGCYKTTGVKTAKLKINNVVLDEEITDEDAISKWPSPYTVRRRESLASDVKAFKYEKISIYYLDCEVTGADKKNYGDCGVHIALCEKFTYKSKDKVGGKIGKWITTNTYSAQVV